MARVFVTNRLSGAAISIAVLLAAATPAAAQSAPEDARPASSYASIFAGAANDGTSARPTVGAALGKYVSRHVAIEGHGRWFNVPTGQQGYVVDLAVRYDRPTASTMPYLSVGIGMSDVSFPTVTDATPSFYRDRVASGDRGYHTFRDPVFTIEGGLDLFANGHVAFRPQIGILMPVTGHDVWVVPVYGLQLAYFFESRPLPTRRLQR